MAERRVLVTGADGFIGSHLAELLVKQGRPVRALCQYNSFNSWGWLDDSPVRDQMEIVTGDVRDPYCCEQIARDVDTIYHLAALIAIPYSYTAPASYVDTNIKGTLHICQAARKHSVRRALFMSTSEVYGTARYVPIDEEHPLQPQSPYSASKIGADQIALSFFAAFELPVTIARPFNTYGPRQSARAVIPTIIAQLADGSRRIELGDLKPTRDFNYVLDTCRGLVALGSCDGAIGEVVNIGSGREISIGETLALIAESMGVEVESVTDEQRLRPSGSEVFRLLCNNEKLQRLTGYEPSVTLQQGLAETIAWFTEPSNLARYKSRIYNV